MWLLLWVTLSGWALSLLMPATLALIELGRAVHHLSSREWPVSPPTARR